MEVDLCCVGFVVVEPEAGVSVCGEDAVVGIEAVSCGVVEVVGYVAAAK